MNDAGLILTEVCHICSLINPAVDLDIVRHIYQDNLKLFAGEYEGYQACNTRYHDLDHTLAVFLATARLIHGVSIHGTDFHEHDILSGLLGALFHDAGFIQTVHDTSGTGAKYTVGHEQRSIQFIQSYLPGKGFSDRFIEDCSQIIACTILSISLDQINFSTDRIRVMGQIVGTADLLAQMADRHYLEKLLFLYTEFEEAQIPGFDSELELLKKTEFFYKNQSQKRIVETLGGIAPLIKLHFRERWQVDRDFYQENIVKNIDYLKTILDTCESNYRSMLRRQ